MEKIIERISRFIKKFQSGIIDKYFEKLDEGMNILVDKLDSIETKLEIEIYIIRKELDQYKSMIEAIGNSIPDMMWCKDLDGKYMYANPAIINGLLFDISPIGKDDIYLATKAKERFGESNHTFGEKCLNSDKVVIEKVLDGTFVKEDGRFLESGVVKGKMLYLEVFKAPLFDKYGNLIGIVGTGRNMTEYIEAYRAPECISCPKMSDIFKKYEYGEGM